MRVQSKSTMKRYSSPLNFLRFLLVQIDHMTALQAHNFKVFAAKVDFWRPFIAKKTKKREGQVWTLRDILNVVKKTRRGMTLHDVLHANASNRTFSTLNFAAVSLPIHVEFLNDKRGKEKDRWCCSLYYWLNSFYYWLFSLAMATKMVTAWSAAWHDSADPWRDTISL